MHEYITVFWFTLIPSILLAALAAFSFFAKEHFNKRMLGANSAARVEYRLKRDRAASSTIGSLIFAGACGFVAFVFLVNIISMGGTPW